MIEKVVNKVDEMDRKLTEVSAQISHLVTKEACAEGRKALSDDLKARMDGDREITGMNITLPAFLQQYSRTEKSSATPSKNHSSTPAPGAPKPVIYYIKAISSIVSLTFAVLAMTFFIYRMMDRMDQQQQTMQTIQRNMQQFERNNEAGLHPHSPEAPAPHPDSLKQPTDPADGS